MTNSLQSTAQINILVVDDTLDNLRLLGKILESQNYKVLKALNGRMALQAAHRNPPDLILLDINMPEMNGYEICQQLKASEVTADIPVIFISALDQVNDKVRAFEMGGRDYITKPFQELEVLARVQNQLLIQQQKQQLQQEIKIRQQAEFEVRQLNQNLERLNSDLEHQVKVRTLELQQALSFELALKQINEQVRDSLDQHRIIQTVIETLAQALEVYCCEASLYSDDHSISIIQYQWTQLGCKATQGQIICTADFPEIYERLKARECIALCQTQTTSIRNHFAILACPIFDDQVKQEGILGDLWLFRETYSSFSEAETRLAQQAANQCAIALRQARLYEAAQTQISELERLNQLKDDFLSTVSHELRTPMSNIRMAIQMLEVSLNRLGILTDESTSINRYFNILKQEGRREISLINDLLDLTRLDNGIEPLDATEIYLQVWVSHLAESFVERTRQHQQQLIIQIPEALPSISTHLPYLERILTELLNNACKYTPAGETIHLSAQALPEGIEICVSNSGVEISAAECDRIFDKFYRIPNSDPWKYGGTGLGLALVKKLVERLGGSIKVDSLNNQTCFKIQIGTGRI